LKHSQTIGLLAALAIIGICFLPWVTIPTKELVITGMNAKGTDFGTPGKVNIFFSVIMAIFFSLPKVWAKRTNVFLGAMHFSWSIRNYILLTSCLVGICPEKQWALVALVIASAISMLMTFFPKIDVNKADKN
jgi:hypothetical protein